jgi:aspartyl-tRNA(Asn)/glutamyl-tRNA(Gln) amidotransferase subunit B
VGGHEFGKRTELKNLNSFRVLAEGTAYEIERQTAVLRAGGTVLQETRGWHEGRRETFSQRSKEEAEDYRYFPEPDLPALHITDEWVAEVRATLPELPDAKLARYQSEYGLAAYEASVLTAEREVAEWFETAVATNGEPKSLANWMINNLFSLMNEHKQTIEQVQITPLALVELIGLVDKQTLNNNTAKDVLAEMFVTGQSAQSIVETKGLAQISDEAAIGLVVAQVLSDNPEMVADYLGGKDKLRGWFVGQIMKATRGKGNPSLVNQLLTQQLAQKVRENQ